MCERKNTSTGDCSARQRIFLVPTSPIYLKKRVILPNKKSYRHFEKHSELPSPDVYLDLLKQLLRKHITC